MPFGLRNAAQSFKRLVDIALQGLPFGKPYLDDILVANRNEPEHMQRLELLFERLARLKARKCQFAKTEVPFVGMRITDAGFGPLPEKVSAIDIMPLPAIIRGLKGSLGMTGFYHRLIPQFSGSAAPLTDLTRGPE